MANLNDQIIELVKKTGDTYVIIDQNGQPGYVVLDFKSYQRLVDGRKNVVGLTQDELLEQINQDVAAWKDNQDQDKLNNWEAVGNIIQNSKLKNRAEKSDQKSEIKTEKIEENLLNIEENKQSEDQYYFEPIE